MKLKIKKLHSDAVMPSYANPGDAGLDLTAISFTQEGDSFVYGTGLAFEIPENHVGLIFPRSSISKYDLILTNHVGVIDSKYRGEVMFKFKSTANTIPLFSKAYEIGDRIGQLIVLPHPKMEPEEAGELDNTERGTGGFGSSGA